MQNYKNDRPSIPALLRREINVEAGHECSVTNCKEHTYLEIHHINGNREDNRKENLILLCDKHHKMAHNDVISKQELYEYKRILQRNLLPSNFERAREADRIRCFINDVTRLLQYRDSGEGHLVLIDLEAGYWFPEEVFQNLLTFLNNRVHYERELRSYDGNIRDTQDQIFNLLEMLRDLRLNNDYRPLGNGYYDYRFFPPAHLGTREYDLQIDQQRNQVADVLIKIKNLMHELYYYIEGR